MTTYKNTKKPATAHSTIRRRYAGLRALGAALPKVARKALGSHGFAEGGLATEWPIIVGQDIARYCLPKKLTMSRSGKSGGQLRDGQPPGGEQGGATLTLRVEPGFATELQHLEPQLIERINGYFGYPAVARIRLQQGRLEAPTNPAPPRKQPLEASAENELQARMSVVADESLRSALSRLGRAVLGRNR